MVGELEHEAKKRGIDFREVRALELQGIPFSQAMEMTEKQIKEKVQEFRKSIKPTGGESFGKNLTRPFKQQETINEWNDLKLKVEKLRLDLRNAGENEKPALEKKLKQQRDEALLLKNKAQNLYKMDLGAI